MCAVRVSENGDGYSLITSRSGGGGVGVVVTVTQWEGEVAVLLYHALC